MTLLISFSEVRDLLMQAGLRKREAEALLARQVPPPVPHGLHSRRRWSRHVVVDFVARLQQDRDALGEGCAGGGFQTVIPPPHVRTR